MPPQTDDLQWIQIRDFKPGLSDDPGSNYPAGAAQRSGTFRCIANRNGALVPLPARQIPFSLPHTGQQTAVTGLYMPPAGMLPGTGPFNPNLFPEHHLFVSSEWIGGGNLNSTVRRYRRFDGPGTSFDVIQSNAVTPPAVWRPGGVPYVSTRSNRATPANPGCPVVVFFSGSGVLAFPDDQNPTSTACYQIYPPYTGGTGSGPFTMNMTAHQGKVVIQLATVYSQGPNAITFMGENMIWSAINDLTTANWLGTRTDPNTGGVSQPAVMVPENPSGYAFMASMSANEIFAVKGVGGLYYTGDLDANGAVVSLPMVTGAEIQQMPAINNLGVIYGNRGSGIWVWTHGPACQLLSPMMSPNFWTLPSPVYPLDDFGGVSYSLTMMDEWIIVPNNFLYDSQTTSWWRLEDDTSIHFRMNTGHGHYLYCSESYYTDTYDTPISFYARETPAASYSWQSHPQWETIDTVIDIRELTLRVRGGGSVTVTLTGESSSTTATFSGISTMLPILIRQPVRIQDANIAVQIQATGSGTPAVAPTVYECNVGYFPAQREKLTMT